MSIRTNLVLVACTLLVAACGGAGAGPPTTTTTPAATTTATSTTTASTTTAAATTVAMAMCRTESLRVTLGQGNGAAGHYYVPIVFTNTGRTCTLTGYPGVSYYAGADQHQVGDAAEREAVSTPTVVLHTGESAYAWVNQVNVGAYDPTRCQPVAATGLRVYPPDNTVPVLLPEPNARGCALHMAGQQHLTVRAVRADASP